MAITTGIIGKFNIYLKDTYGNLGRMFLPFNPHDCNLTTNQEITLKISGICPKCKETF